jgi:hypothetical protein
LLLASPAQSFSGPSPAGLMTTFYCLRVETPPTWTARFRIYIPQEQGVSFYNSVRTENRRLPRTVWLWCSVYPLSRESVLIPQQSIRCVGHVLTEPLSSNELFPAFWHTGHGNVQQWTISASTRCHANVCQFHRNWKVWRVVA